MIRMAFVLAAAIASFGWQTGWAKAYEAPWCAVSTAKDGYWDCQYRSFEECRSRAGILGGNRGFCNPSPYYVAGSAEQRQTRRARRARPQ